MRLQDYWGVGPKTAELLRESIGESAAVAAIEAADVRTLVEAGLPRGRATRILRRAHGGEVDLLATPDAREVYNDLLDLAAASAPSRGAADRVRVLTPLASVEERVDRLDRVETARAAWTELSESAREAVLAAFEEYDDRGESRLAAVETALAITETVDAGGPFGALADLDRDALTEAADALAGLDGDLDRVDDRLAAERERLEVVEELAATPAAVLESVEGVGGDRFRDAVVDEVVTETGVGRERVREAAPREAADATDFVRATLRSLVETLKTAVEERERQIRADLESTVAERDVDRAVEAVDDLAVVLSLARFAERFDLVRPALVEDGLAVEGARNMGLVAAGETVQSVEYAVGDHDLSAPAGDRVAVLTGANSGGKTTLLETLAQVTLLAAMGLPVPADRAAVAVPDRLVFHRRHASFNAGVLESTLRSVVPPVTGEGTALMLVDEFEAITEPGRAADLLHGLVTLTVDREALGVFVTHLADDLEPLPGAARVDGIAARGLDPDMELRVDYQPEFGSVGRSTPEFIVSRLLANAEAARERAGFEHLARAVGEEAVQRTLTDARWSE
jgi:hypothetical protein